MPNLERTELSPGVYLNRLTDERFKKQRINILLTIPVSRQTITKTALLPYLLERSTAECPDPAALQRRLMALYGASYSCNSGKMLGKGYVSASLEGPRGLFLPDGEIEKKYTGFISSCLFNPDMPDGSFRADCVEIEKKKLGELIASQYNDKRYFCHKTALAAFYGSDPRGLDSYGYAEDLPEIFAANLSQHYHTFTKTGAVEIFSVNAGDIGGLGGGIEPREVPEQSPLPAIGYIDTPKLVEIADSVAQSTLSMIFTGGRTLNRRERAALRVACALFGGAPTSRLFMNVREKQSLCYYCSAAPDLMNSTISVTTGVAHENAVLVRESVLRELDSLCRGITKKELIQTKLLLKNMFLELDENVTALCGWYTSAILCGLPPYTPAQELELLQSITADEVIEIMSMFKLHTVCRVGKETDA